MASGRLASIYPGDTNVVNLFTCPTGKKIVATIRACNQTTDPISVNMWLSDGTYDEADVIEPTTPIQGNTVLENSGILMGEGDTLHVQTLEEGVNFIVWGLEETA